jgi:hypothetical protein
MHEYMSKYWQLQVSANPNLKEDNDICLKNLATWVEHIKINEIEGLHWQGYQSCHGWWY